MTKVQPIKPDNPLVRMFIVYTNGNPLYAFESTDSRETCLKDLREGVQNWPADWDCKDATTVPYADLERLEKMNMLKLHLFNVSQIQTALRAGKHGLVVARPGDAPAM